MQEEGKKSKGWMEEGIKKKKEGQEGRRNLGGKEEKFFLKSLLLALNWSG